VSGPFEGHGVLAFCRSLAFTTVFVDVVGDGHEVMIIITRMAKSQTSSSTWIASHLLGNGQHDEGDQRHTGHAVGLEAVGGRADRVAGVVASTVGDHAGVARIVLLDVEDSIFIKSEPMSAILVKMPPAILSAAAPSDSPMAKPMKHLPARSAGTNSRMAEHDQQFGGDQQHADSNVTSFVLAPASAGGGGDPNNYVFFDDIHPTAKTHALLANAITETLNPEPVVGFSATQGTAALALQAIGVGAHDARVAQIAGSNRATGRADAYASFNYGDGNRSADGWRRKFSYAAQVVSAGADLRVSDGFLAGATINTGRLTARLSSSGGNYRMEDLSGRAYGVWSGGPVAFAFDASYGSLTVAGIHRTTGFAGFQTNGKTSGDHWGAGMKALWKLDVAGLNLRPWAGLRTERVKLRGYTEKDVPVVGMDFEGQQARSSAGSIGVDWGADTKVAARAVRFDLRAAWHGELTNKQREVAGKLTDNVTRLTTISTEDGDGSGFELGGAATLFFAKNWSASLGYTGDIRSGDKLASRGSLSLQTGF
jgi:uncharacterized protein YhjY with autotransporter beta-barrel domain